MKTILVKMITHFSFTQFLRKLFFKKNIVNIKRFLFIPELDQLH
jgi:hypothetical protein